MPGENLRRIKQQPLDKSDDSTRYYPFPPLTGLDAPSPPATLPVRPISLQRVYGRTGEQLVFRATLSASPFHGVLRLALRRGDGHVSQSFHNGKGQAGQDGMPGGYGDEVTDILTCDPRLDNLRLCWTVRNPERFRTVTLALFGRDRSDPVWSLTWDADQTAAHIRQDAPPPGPNGSALGRRPMPWTGSLAWAAAVQITDPAFPDGQLTAEHGPYQLRMTIDDNDPGPDKLGYPLVAWTYLQVVAKGWLGVQVLYQGMPLAGIPVRFYTLTAENQPDSQIGEEQITDASGSAYLSEAVETGEYGCHIEGQPLATVTSVDDPNRPLLLTLPIGESPVDVYGLLGDDLDAPEDDEEPAETVEAGEPLPKDVEAKGWLAVQVLYQGIPLAGMPVRFYTLTTEHRTASQIGEEQVTDADGSASLEEVVVMGDYGCDIEGQPLAIIRPVGDADRPFVLTLPIGEPPVDVYGPIGDMLDEMDEEEASEPETV
ncbi:MAG TPA: hypothetical protein VLQ80_02845 [Candidatus Saccharimonadia bacterium]|nr:hypothetical protein [Candidatus Saccharimonadia bacterium]